MSKDSIIFLQNISDFVDFPVYFHQKELFINGDFVHIDKILVYLNHDLSLLKEVNYKDYSHLVNHKINPISTIDYLNEHLEIRKKIALLKIQNSINLSFLEEIQLISISQKMDSLNQINENLIKLLNFGKNF